ncbi:MAG: hypothetical protein U0270_35790 [Labilithrix sp.]
MKLSLGPLAVVAMFAGGCSAQAADDPAAAESNVTGSATIAPGKYVADGKMLMVYSTCSAANFLGEAATGAIDASGIIRAPEGDVCGSYKLATTAEGEVTVTWVAPAGSHLGAEVASACRSQEGKYLMMQPGAFREPKAGVYAKPNSAATLTVPAGCDTPTSLSGGGAVIARTRTDDEHPAGFLATDEGNVCSGYTYTALANGTLEVTWAPPSNASIAHDLGVSAACKSVAGIYKPR